MTGKDSNVHYKTSFAHIINRDVILATEASLYKCINTLTLQRALFPLSNLHSVSG